MYIHFSTLFIGIKRAFSHDEVLEISSDCSAFILSRLRSAMDNKEAQISKMGCEIEFLKVENESLNVSIRQLKDENCGLQKRICLQDKRLADMEAKQDADIQRLQNSLQNYISRSSSTSNTHNSKN